MMQLARRASLVIVLLLAYAPPASAACGGSGTDSGTVAIAITDGPIQASDGRTIVRLEIDIGRIELENEDDQGPGDGGEVVVFNDPANPIRVANLLTVRTVAELLTTVSVPVGT